MAALIELDKLAAFAMLPATVLALFAFYRSRGHKPERVSDEIEDFKPLKIIQFETGSRLATADLPPQPKPRPLVTIPHELKSKTASGFTAHSAAMPILLVPPAGDNLSPPSAPLATEVRKPV